MPRRIGFAVLIFMLLPLAGCKKGIDPDHDYNIGLGWMKSEEPDHAVESFTSAIEANPKNADAYHMRATNLQLMEKYAEARTDYDMALKLNPKLAAALADRAELDLLEGLPEQAILDADAAIELDSKLGEAYLHRGKANLQLERLDEAIKDATAANKMLQGDREANARAHSMLGQIYLTKQDYTEAIYNYSLAIDFYNGHISRYPKHQVTTTGVEGKVWAGKAAYDAAAKVFIGRTEAYLAQDKVTEAFEDAKKAVRLDEESADALLMRARAYVRLTKYLEAKKDLNRAISLKEDQADLYNLRGWISATCPQSLDRDGLKAVEDAKRACELTNYKNADYLETLAAAYAETEVFDKALQWQNEAIIIGGEDKATERRARFQVYQSKKPYRMLEKQ